jgi:hypothetical protein
MTHRLLASKFRNDGFSRTDSTRALIKLDAREMSFDQAGTRPQWSSLIALETPPFTT